MEKRIDGLLVVDKPEGMTSLDIVRQIKLRLGIKKAGHIGTLDPFATGVLPVVINEGTKLVPYLSEGPKEYEVTLKLGEETTTDDWTGQVIKQGSYEGIDPKKIEAIFQTFLGNIQQIPPMFSAIKMKGQPLYRLARKGIEIERKERAIEIYRIQVDKIELPFIYFSVSCSKGTYIRALGRDIGRKLGCGSHLLCLKRTRSGTFTLSQAISLEALKNISTPNELSPWLISLNQALSALPEFIADEHLVKKVRLGQEMRSQDLISKTLPHVKNGEWFKMSSPREGLVAILISERKRVEIPEANVKDVVFRPLRIFHPNPKNSAEDYA